MTLAKSKLTAQGQISVPAEVRRKLGLAPGSVIEWTEENDEIVVRRVGRYSSKEIHRALFASPPDPVPDTALKDAIRGYLRKRHARR
jgi:AbrB family looped-hinge helix DNA binding protein